MKDSDAEVSRRNFLLRAGQLGAAFTVLGPAFGNRLFATVVHAPPMRGADGLAPAGDAPTPAELYSQLRWRMLGPLRGGRVDAVSGVPGRPNEFYFGSVNGGVWKSVDAGRVWEPVFDGQPVASIGAIAVAPSSPNTVYVGSGESTLRDSAGYGNGVYKSTDAGATWMHMGLADTQHIGKIAVDPRNPNVVFVAAIGHLYAASSERGVFRSRDGGRTWDRVLHRGDDVGAIEVVIDPSNSNVIYAGLWNTRRPPWYTYAPSNGPGGGIFKSTDGGTTWKQLTHGLPPEGIGRTGIAVSPTNPRRVYAVVDCLIPDPNAPLPPPAQGGGAGGRPAAPPQRPGQGGFFRSDDAGATWTRMSADEALWGRGWYFEHIAVDPRNEDIVYVPNVAVSRTMDGGRTWLALRGSPGGDDYHQAWVSPDDPNTVIVASDQGAVITRNARANPMDVTWSSWLNQPTAQIYHVAVDYRFPYWVHGAQQDSGAVAVRSRGKFAEITMRDWEPIGAGGESGYTAGDPLHPGIIYGGTGSRYDLELNVSIPGTTQPRASGTDPARTDWTQPLVLSAADPHKLYYANQYLFRSTDQARTWTQISQDLTRANPGVPASLDAASAADTDRNGKRGVIYTVAPSPLQAALVWIGTDDGLIQVTPDDGGTWHDVTPAAIGPWSRVTMIEASHFDPRSAYASVDRHQLQDFDPYIYRTRDMGATWQRISTGLPAGVYVHVIKEDPVRRGLLFAGTERGAYVSFDDGDNWQPLQLNLPVTSVRDFVIYNNDLVVATHGRGFWVIDDIAPLRQMDAAVASRPAYLFKPSDVVYVDQGGDNGTPTQKDEPQAPQAPDGAAIDYYIGSGTTGPVTLEIVNAGGEVVRAYTTGPAAANVAGGFGGRGRTGGIPNVSALWQTAPEPFSGAPGMHRVVWTPVAAGRGRGGGGFGRAAAPLTGTFTARLIAGGQTLTQTFDVKPDPRLASL